jgi:hypothetical protein
MWGWWCWTRCVRAWEGVGAGGFLPCSPCMVASPPDVNTLPHKHFAHTSPHLHPSTPLPVLPTRLQVHYLGDPGRGSVWEETIISLPAGVQVLACSATVSNPEDLAGWMSEVGRKGQMEERPWHCRQTHRCTHEKGMLQTIMCGRARAYTQETCAHHIYVCTMCPSLL